MKLNKIFSAVLALALTASLMVGCGSKPASSAPAASSETAAASSEAAEAEAPAASSEAEAASEETAAEALAAVTIRMVDPDGIEHLYAMEVEEGCTMSDALLSAGLINEDEAAAGFFTVFDGITADWNADQSWWGIVDSEGEMTPVGINDILLTDGDLYGIIYNAG